MTTTGAQAAGTERSAEWDADKYDRQFGYVSALAGGVMELLGPSAGETILDLGCGTGELTATIREAGATVLALDSDPEMVAAASARLGQEVILADGHDFRIDQPVDAVFSNAALHWMTRPAEVLDCVRAALRPGGRFVAEMGGARNVATIVGAVRTALEERRLADLIGSPWYFPSPAEYAALLESHGFRVARLEHFPRPTDLSDCPDGVADWVGMFGEQLIGHVPAADRPALLARINELAAPVLYRGGSWLADYWRLRFVAVAGEPGALG
jgi:trans-aconitate methyltransferase